MIKKLSTLIIMTIVGLGIGFGLSYAQFSGGNGAGWGVATSSSSVALSGVSADTNTKLIRAGRTITNVARTSGGISTITLSSAYPNNNLKTGQKIVVSGCTDTTFNGTFTITAVAADYTTLSYVQALGYVASKSDTTGTVGGNYTSLNSWVAGEGGTLSAIKVAECYNDWSSGLSENVSISGNTTTSSYYMMVTAPPSEQNNGTSGTGFKISGTLTIGDTYAYIKGIEVTGETSITSTSVTTAGNLIFGAGLTLSSSTTINAGDSNMLIATSLSMISGSTFNAQGSQVTFSDCDAAFNLGTFNANQGMIIFKGISTWTPKSGGSYNIVKFATGTTNISTNTPTITNLLVLDTGSSGAVNGSAITLTGDLLCLSGTGGTSAITMNNTSLPQNITGAASGSGGTTPAITINKSGQYVNMYGILGMTSLTLSAGTINLYRDSNEAANTFNVVGTFAVNAGTVYAIGNTAVTNSDSGGTLADPHGAGVVVNAATFTLASGTTFSATGKGFGTTYGPGKGSYSTYGSGAGHSSAGGSSLDNCTVGTTYGSATAPTALGSGGGGVAGDSGYGGGAIKLVVSGTATINGTLSADGVAGSYAGASGGSIWVIADTLAGSGSITAKGAASANSSYHGGGSGGRILTTSTTSTFSGTTSSASGAGYAAGAFSSNSFVPASLVVGSYGNVTVNFTTANIILSTGKILVTFPSDFTLDYCGKTLATSSSMDGNFDVSVSGQVATLTRRGGTDEPKGAQVLTLTNIKNPNDAATTGTYSLQTQGASGYTIDSTTGITGTAITNGGTLSSTSVTLDSTYTSASGSVTVKFTTVNPIPVDGKIIFTFPSGYNVSGVNAATSATIPNGTLTTAVDGQVVTVTRSGGTTQAASGIHYFTLSTVVNPVSSGTTAAYSIKTTTASSNSTTGLIDSNTAVSGTLIKGYLSSPTVSSGSYIAGVTANTVISFTTVGAVATGGSIEVDFPSGYNLAGAIAYVSNTGITGANVALTVNPNTLIFSLGASTYINANTAVTLTVSGIKNPDRLGSTGSYTVRTKNASGATIDSSSSAPVNTIVIPTLTITSPNGGESWTVGTSHNLTWSSSGTIDDNLSLFYSTDSGSNYNTIVSSLSNSGSYAWTVPAVPSPGTTNIIKISVPYYQDIMDTTVTDFNAGQFSGTTVIDNGTPIDANVVIVPTSLNIPVVNVYYSLGQDTNDHKTGSPAMSIVDGIATFSVAQTATNMGVGDMVTYGGDSCYLAEKISTSKWKVVTVRGAKPADVSAVNVDAIKHCFSSLADAVSTTNSGAAALLGTSDLCSGNYVLNIACYYDSGPDSSAPITITGWTSSTINYLRVFTPNNTSTECNQSQRHTGKRTANVFTLSASCAYGLTLNLASNVRIDGFQITNSGGTGIFVTDNTSDHTGPVISNTLIYECTGHGIYARGNGMFANVIAMHNSLSGFFADEWWRFDNFVNCAAVNNGNYGFHTYYMAVFGCYNCYAGGNASGDYDTIVAGSYLTMFNSYSADTTYSTKPHSSSKNNGQAAFSTSSGAYFTNVTAGSEDLSIGSSSLLKGAGQNMTSGFAGDWRVGFRSPEGYFKSISGNLRLKSGAWDVGPFATYIDNSSIIIPTQVYYSVGQNVSDHKTGSPTITISNGIATFSVAQTATNMGVGDKITYGGVSCYISAKISNTKWKVVTVTGALPDNVPATSVSTIAHCFSSLTTALPSASGGAKTLLGTTDLVAGNYILNISCYYDSDSDTARVDVANWTTSKDNYIKIYTPVNTSTECNQSQRHNGKWDSTKYNLKAAVPGQYCGILMIEIPNVWIDGLQVYATSLISGYSSGIIYYSVTLPNDTVYITNNIVRGPGAAEPMINNNHIGGIFIYTYSSNAASRIYIANNIIYDIYRTSDAYSVAGVHTITDTTSVYIYNNTIYNCCRAVGIHNIAPYFFNNIAQSTYAFGYAYGDYNLMNIASYSTTGSHTTIGTATFTDAANGDFRLVASDTAAIGTGINLSSTDFSTLSTDAQGRKRPATGSWDLGAMQYATTSYYMKPVFYSRVIDAGANNTLNTFNYTANVPTYTGLNFQLAASADGVTWSDFVGPYGTTSDYFTSSGEAIPASLASYRYFKYKAIFESGWAQLTPSLLDVTVNLSANAAGGNTSVDTSDAIFSIVSGGVGGTASVTPASLVAGSVNNVTVAFTSINTIPSNGKIVVTFPANFALSSGASTTATSTTLDGTLTVTVNGQAVTITRSAGTDEPAGAQSIVLTNIKNPDDTGTTGTYAVQTQNAAGYAIDSASAITGSAITNGGTLLFNSVTPASRLYSASGNLTATFCTINPIPYNGKIVITLPAGYTLSSGGTTAATSSTIDGTLTTGINGQIVTITRSASTQSIAGVKSIILSHVANPSSAGSYGPYSIQTYTASSNATTGLIDSNTSIAATYICNPAISSPASSATYSVGSNYTITWSGCNSEAVKLFYSRNGGTDGYPYLITDSVTGTSYSWLIPDVGADTIALKMQLVADSSVYATVTGISINKSSITITSPNGGENWYPYETRSITWSQQGLIGDTLALSYSTDNFSTSNLITNFNAYPYPNSGAGLGGVTLTTGKLSTAASFNGSTAYVSVPNNPSLSPEAALSIEAWIKAASLTAGTKSPGTTTTTIDPIDVAVDAGYLYILDGTNQRIVKTLRSGSGGYIKMVGSSGTGSDNFNFNGLRSRLCSDETYLYISDTNNDRVVKRLKSDLSYVDELNYTDAGLGINSGFAPGGITCDNNYLYVMSIYGQNGIFKFNKNTLTLETSLVPGTAGTGINQFASYTSDLSCDDNYLYVADRNNGRIHIRNKSDLSYVNMITLLAPSYANTVANDSTYIYTVENNSPGIVRYLKSNLSRVDKTGTYGTVDGTFSNTPCGMEVDGDYIYVTDLENKWVAIWNKSALTYNRKVASVNYSGYPTLISKQGLAGNDYSLQIDSNNGKVLFNITDSSAGLNTLSSSSALSAGVWYHVAATYDGSNMKLYINNVLDGTKALVGTITAGNAPLVFGVSGELDNGFYSGLLDETAVWNKALSASEVSARYNGGNGAALTGSESGLAGLWHFNDSSYTGAPGEVVDSVARNAGTYSWTVPLDISDTVKVKISQSQSRYFKDESSTDFNLGTPAFSSTEVSGTGTSAGIVLSTSGTWTKKDIAVGTHPNGVAFDSSTNSVWVVNLDSNSVTKIRACDGVVLGTYTVGTNPQGIAFDSYTNSIWVANCNSHNVNKIRASDGTILGTYSAGGAYPGHITFDPSTNSIWISNYGNFVKRSVTDGSLLYTGSYVANELQAAFDSYTNSIWLPNMGSNVIQKIRASDGVLLGSYPTSGTWPRGVAFDPSTNSVWVTNQYGHAIQKFRAADGALLGTYPLGGGEYNVYPYDVVFDSATNSIWVSYSHSVGKVAQLRASDGTILAVYDTGSSQGSLAYDSLTKSVWAGNYDANTVSRLSPAYPVSGTYTSRVIDTTSNTGFSKITWTESLLPGTAISMKVRSSTAADFTGAIDWSSCAVLANGASLSGVNGVTSGNRYVQYQATLTSSGTATPTLGGVTLYYATDNLSDTSDANFAIKRPKLVFTQQPAGALAGATLTDIKVSVENADNQVLTSDATQVTLTVTGAGAELLGTATVNAVSGVATFSGLSIQKTGTFTLTATSAAGYTSVASSSFSIVAATPTKLAFSQQPSATSTAGAAFTQQPKIAIQDEFGNTVTSATNNVTLAISSNPGGGTLSGTATVAAVDGIATFSGLNINKSAENYNLLATCGSLTETYSDYFTIQLAPASKIVFASDPTPTSISLPYYYVQDVAYDTTNKCIWMVTDGSGSSSVPRLYKVNVSTNAITSSYTPFTGITSPARGIAYDPVNNALWVTIAGAVNKVYKISASDASVIGSYLTGSLPQGVCFDPYTNSVWVANNGAATVSKFRAADGALLGTYAAGTSPHSVLYDPSTTSIWVSNNGADTVSNLNVSTGAKIRTDVAVGSGPKRMAYDSYTDSIWVINENANSISKITAGVVAATLKNSTSYYNPMGIAFDSTSNSMWISDSFNNKVAKLNALDNSVVAVYSTIRNAPRYVTFVPYNNTMWVTSYTSVYTAKFELSQTSFTPAALTAGVVSGEYTVMIRDAYDNLRNADDLVLALTSSSGAGKFDTSAEGAFNGSITTITTVDGVGTFYYKDTLAGTPLVTVSYTGLTPATQTQSVSAAGTAHISLNAPADLVAGNLAAYTVTRYDQFNNLQSSGEESVTFSTDSASGNALFYNAASEGTAITGINIPNGSSAANFWYYDEKVGAYNITASMALAAPSAPTPVSGSDNGQFNAPQYIAVDPSGNIYVTDTGNGRVQKFNSSGTFLLQFGQTQTPIGVAVDSAGNVYVADGSWYNRITKFDSSGTYLSQFGSLAETTRSAGIAIDSAGNVYIADYNGRRILKYDSSGTFVLGIGNGTTWTSMDSAPTAASGTDNGYFSYAFPAAVAVDSAGNIYATDQSRIQKFNSSGVFLLQFGNTGSAGTNGRVVAPYGIAVDSANNIYVADGYSYYPQRVQKFDSSGNYLSQFGSTGTGNGQFNGLYGITLDSSGNIYAADNNNHRIQKFDSSGNFLMGIGNGTTWGVSGISTTDALNVMHAAANHLLFTDSITPPSKVGVEFGLPAIKAVDQFNNLADSTYGATPYSGAKTIGYTLSGTANSPDWVSGNDFGQDTWTTAVTFTNGVSTTALKATLYRSQDTSITPGDVQLSGGNIASEYITINPDTAVKLVFTQQPSPASIVNSAFVVQPQVSIRDTYGNQTLDNYFIQLYDSASAQQYIDASGSLGGTTNQQAVSGKAEFGDVEYNTPGTIYLYAEAAGTLLNQAFSSGVVLTTSQTTSVDRADSPQPSFNLIPTNDTAENKFSVIKFKVNDKGGDKTPTIIDQIKIAVGGSGANASTDIVWAGLYVKDKETSEDTFIADATSIANDYITFGATPDNNNLATLHSVTDTTSDEFTVYIYMKDSKLTAVDKQTYTFAVNESNIGIDTGTSSRMAANSSAVSGVVGTIAVDVSALEIVTESGTSSSASTISGAALPILVRATDANRNIDKDYTGNHTLVFSGLSSIGTAPNIYYPKTMNALGAATTFDHYVTISFANGVTGSGAVNLYAYKKVAPTAPNVVAQEYGLSYTQYGLSLTVNPAASSAISILSGNNQSGRTSWQLPQAFVAQVSDAYGNAVGEGTGVDFAILSIPVGATGSAITTTSGTTNTNGQASTTLTIGNLPGAYQVSATSAGLTGSPLTFNVTGLVPGALQIVSGNNQTKQVTSALDTALVVKVTDASGIAIPNETVTFAISTSPTGAIGQALSVASAVTDSTGQASTVLTLGDKSGAYKVTATSGSLASVTLTATATAKEPYKVALSGPVSVRTGEASAEFSVLIQDEHGNNSDLTQESVFSLATNPVRTTGAFYSDSACLNAITSVNITAHSATFYYKDTKTGTANIVAELSAGQALTVASTVKSVTVMPSDAYRFVVSGSTDAIAAGGSKVITVTTYDQNGNIKTDYTQDVNIVLSGANSSPAPSADKPVCSNKANQDVNFGSSTTLAFANGVASATLKLYKAETVLIKATSGAVTTADADGLTFIVTHATVNHLKFAGNIPAAQVAGKEFSFDTTLLAVDLYNNICDGANGLTAFAGSKQITWTLSGIANGPEGNVTDKFVSPVTFVSGASDPAVSALKATLYYAQSTTITASTVSLTGANIASNSIVVSPDVVAKLKFNPQPSSACVTSQALAQQPKVFVADQYGNPAASTSANVSLSAYLDTNTPATPATNGILSATGGLTQTTVNGIASFAGLTYSYPENIFLKATVAGVDLSPVYSSQITFSTASEATVTAGTLVLPSEISSLVNTLATKVNILDFKVTDAGSDGFATKLKQVVVKRDTTTDTTAGWTNYIEAAYISDGITQTIGVVENDQITFGSGNSVMYSVTNNTNKTFTFSLFLKQALPSGADGKVFSFKMDPNANITLDTVSSKFNTTNIFTNAPVLAVVATDFIISGPTTMNAGVSQVITLKATDTLGNIDKDYTGDKALVFSGASVSSKGQKPTATSYVPTDIAFGSNTAVTFTNGVNSSPVALKLYTAETATIKATDGILTTANTNSLILSVYGGAAVGLTWYAQPVAVVVENAPWKEFSVMASDAYGNISSSTPLITITPSAGTLVAGAISATTAQSGLATFYNFAVNELTNGQKITLNASADGLTSSGNSNEVAVYKRYNVTLKVNDYTSATALSECTISAVDAYGTLVEGFPQTGNSPFTCNLPYGSYVFTITKEKYVDEGTQKIAGPAADYLDGTYDAKIAWTITVTSLAEATADYNVKNAFVYDESTDKLSIRLWLEKRGKLIVDDSVNNLGVATITIYDDVSGKWLAPINIESDTGGVYLKEIPSVIVNKYLTSGKTYYAKTLINYGGTEGTARSYESGTTFSVTINETLKTVTSAIQTITTSIAGQTSEIKTVVKDEIKKQVEEVVVPKITDVKTETSKILTATGTESLATKIAEVKTQVVDEIQPSVKSGILNRENTVKQGNSLTIRYRTATGLAPLISVYNPKGSVVVANRPMKEVGASGIYEYSVTFNASWGKGDYSVVCSEPTLGTVDALVITAAQTDLASLDSSVSAVLGNTGGITNLKNATTTISTQFSDMDKMINKISKDMATKLEGAKGAVSELSNTFKQLEDLSKQIKDIGGNTGINLEKLYEVSKDKKEDITYIKNKSEELKAAMEINQKMIENVAKKPVVQTWFEFK